MQFSYSADCDMVRKRRTTINNFLNNLLEKIASREKDEKPFIVFN